jgi:sugar/nucleoside kinase (ribokinase family)
VASTPALENEPDEVAAEKSCEEVDRFLKKIGMWLSEEALRFANAVAALTTTQLGAIPALPGMAAVERLLKG